MLQVADGAKTYGLDGTAIIVTRSYCTPVTGTTE